MKIKSQEEEHPDMRILRYARAISLKTVCVEFMQVQYITVGESLKFIGQPCGNNLNVKA